MPLPLHEPGGELARQRVHLAAQRLHLGAGGAAKSSRSSGGRTAIRAVRSTPVSSAMRRRTSPATRSWNRAMRSRNVRRATRSAMPPRSWPPRTAPSSRAISVSGDSAFRTPDENHDSCRASGRTRRRPGGRTGAGRRRPRRAGGPPARRGGPEPGGPAPGGTGRPSSSSVRASRSGAGPAPAPSPTAAGNHRSKSVSNVGRCWGRLTTVAA
ncbi:hypothetical protein [Actinomadura madurae]|uniref:hypothetical protein n=1 Tax=Actinomadura madurae TaxID=1993 RepID=UPI0020D23461|nr:hypothetical protein [Actinomadura madurae]MCQ0013441.1 hypothetical protein [Actinomadura madurae]